MKKILYVILVLLLVLVVTCACVELDPVTILQEKLSATKSATTVKHTIKVLAGAEQLSLQEDTYQVQNDSVLLTHVVTELNPNYVTDGQKWITTTQTATLTVSQLHAKIPHNVNLTMQSLVQDSYNTIRSGNTITHKMTILPECVQDFLGVSAEQANTINNLQVTVVEFDEQVTSLTLFYTSTTGNTVTIVYSFTY